MLLFHDPVSILCNETFPFGRLGLAEDYFLLEMMTDGHRQSVCSVQIFNAFRNNSGPLKYLEATLTL